jgi:hypothetical protein
MRKIEDRRGLVVIGEVVSGLWLRQRRRSNVVRQWSGGSNVERFYVKVQGRTEVVVWVIWSVPWPICDLVVRWGNRMAGRHEVRKALTGRRS